MTWESLFETAADYETSIEEIRDTLAERRGE